MAQKVYFLHLYTTQPTDGTLSPTTNRPQTNQTNQPLNQTNEPQTNQRTKPTKRIAAKRITEYELLTNQSLTNHKTGKSWADEPMNH